MPSHGRQEAARYLVRSARRASRRVAPGRAAGVTALVSYERAKAESLGLSGQRRADGARAERMILLGVAFPDSAFVVPVLRVMCLS